MESKQKAFSCRGAPAEKRNSLLRFRHHSSIARHYRNSILQHEHSRSSPDMACRDRALQSGTVAHGCIRCSSTNVRQLLPLLWDKIGLERSHQRKKYACSMSPRGKKFLDFSYTTHCGVWFRMAEFGGQYHYRWFGLKEKNSSSPRN